ncbi:lipoprotein [Caudoviricetes sp.]|nr:lipoprotein [Caudoviricetes sp.]
MRKIALVLLLGGCAMTDAQKLEIISGYAQNCSSMGIPKNTPQFDNCVIAQIQRPNTLGRSLQGAGAVLNPQVYQQTHGAPAPSITNCTTDYLGTHCTTGY